MKKYIYKLYDEDGLYIKTLPEDEVTSPFEYSQQTGDSFVELPIKLARTSEEWNEGGDIDFNHIVVVTCVDKEQPNGVVVFQGKIINYAISYDHPQSIEIMCQSFGQDMESFIIVEDEQSDIAQLTGAGETTLNYERPIAQSFTADNTSISSVDLKLKTTGSTTVEILICPNNGSNQPDTNNPLGTGTKLITNTSYEVLRVPLTASVNLSASVTYWIVVRNATVGSTANITPSEQGSMFSNGGTSYANFRDGSSFVNTSSTISVGEGESIGATNYFGMEGLVNFNPSATLPANALISSAVMKWARSVNGSYNRSNTYEAFERDWGNTVETSDWVAGANIGALTKLATFAATPASFLQDTLYTWTSEGDTLRQKVATALSALTKVRMLLSTDTMRTGSAPSDNTSDNGIYGSGDLSIRLTVTYSAETITAQYNTTAGTYTGGKLMSRDSAGTWSDLTGDLYFQTNTATGATKPTYTSQDPAEIVDTIMTNYQGRGGAVDHEYGVTVVDAGFLVTYTFNSNTILEGLKKLAELAGADYYFYVDVATNTLYFLPQSGAFEHHFTIGKDVTSLKIDKRTEGIVNVIYFTGGEISEGVNFYKKYINSVSVAKYGQKAISYSDQRVTVEATADTIASTILSAKAEPEIRLTIEVVDSNYYANGYDLETINVGDMITFRNFGEHSSLWDKMLWDADYWDYGLRNVETLVLQVVRLERKPDKVILGVSTSVSDAVNRRIDQISRTLKDTIQQNNPTTPSEE